MSARSESEFLRWVDKKHNKCPVCGGGKFLSCTWMCEGHPHFVDYFNSGMFNPEQVTWKNRSDKDYVPFYLEIEDEDI